MEKKTKAVIKSRLTRIDAKAFVKNIQIIQTWTWQSSNQQCNINHQLYELAFMHFNGTVPQFTISSQHF